MSIWKKLKKCESEYIRKIALNKRLLSKILADTSYFLLCLNGNNIIKTIDTFVPAPQKKE